MSWAAKLKVAASTPIDTRSSEQKNNLNSSECPVETVGGSLAPHPSSKPIRVIAEDTSSEPPLGDAVLPLKELESENISLPSYSKGLLIIDANVIIKGIEALLSSADAFITTPAVVAELKDRDSRDMLNRLPYQLHLMEPSSAAVRRVIECAQKTGDFGVLSTTDIRLCALAYDCAAAETALRPPIHPSSAVQEIQSGQDVRVMKEEMCDEEEESDEEEEENKEEVRRDGVNNREQNIRGIVHKDDDDEEGWITPENIIQKTQELAPNADANVLTAFAGGLACVTSDYAMQNVLLHLGVPLVGTNGMCIAELRLWLLRCTSCFAVVTDTTRQFCPKCGSGDTLRRVHYIINEKGEKKLFINFKRRLSTRGTVYNLPKPRGGKHGTNRLLVLREDQLAHVIRGTTAASLKAKQAMRKQMNDKEGLEGDLAMFGAPEKSKKRDLAAPRLTSSYHKYNVNEKKKVRAAHRK